MLDIRRPSQLDTFIRFSKLFSNRKSLFIACKPDEVAFGLVQASSRTNVCHLICTVRSPFVVKRLGLIFSSQTVVGQSYMFTVPRYFTLNINQNKDNQSSCMELLRH